MDKEIRKREAIKLLTNLTTFLESCYLKILRTVSAEPDVVVFHSLGF